MKKILLVLSVSLLALTANSQSESNFGKFYVLDIPFGLQSTMQTIYPGPDGTAYAITSQKAAVSTAWSAQTIIAHKLSADFAFLNEFKLENVKYMPFEENGGVAFVTANDNLYVLSIYDKDNQVKIYQTPVENSDQQKLLGQFALAEKAKANLSEIIQSPDQKLFAAIVNVDEKEGVQSVVVTFDNRLKTISQYNFRHSENMIDRKYAMNNAGDIVCLETSDNNPGKKEKIALSFDFHLFKDGKQQRTYSLKDIDEATATAQISANDRHFYADILCSHSAEVNVKGKKQNQDKFSLYHYHLDPSLTLIHHTKSDISHAKMEQIRDGDKFYGDQIKLKGLFPMKDSMCILVGEASDYRDITFHHTDRAIVANPSGGFQMGPATTTTSQRPNWQYTGIFVMLLDASGVIKDTKIIEREMYGAFLPLYVVRPLKVDENVFFTYWDAERLTHLVRFNIDEAGELAWKEKTMDQDVLEGRAIESPSLNTDGNLALYAKIDHPRKKAKVLKMMIK